MMKAAKVALLASFAGEALAHGYIYRVVADNTV